MVKQDNIGQYILEFKILLRKPEQLYTNNMNNVHGFGDLPPSSGENLNRNSQQGNSDRHQRRRQRQQQQQRDGDNEGGGIFGNAMQPLTIQNMRAAEEHRVLFISGNNTRIKDPRKQNYWDMLKNTCCPVVKLLSVTTLILLAQLTMYIISIVKGIDESKQLLQIEAQVLFDLGANYSPSIKQGQVWRLVSAMFLHVTFIHFVGNFITTLIFVSRVEYTFGWWKTLIVYILSGIGGNIFSVLLDGSNTVIKAGASTALYGIIGVILGYIFINWKGFEVIGSLLKCQLLCISAIIIIFIFVLTPYSQNVDLQGHAGGFITGVTLTCIHGTIRKQTYEKIMRISCLAAFIIFFLLCFLLFYLLD